MPRRMVKMDADGFAADPNDPNWDNLSERSFDSNMDPWTRKRNDEFEAANPELNTIEEVQAKWESMRSYFSQSKCREAVRELLQARRPTEGWKIKTAVIFASGNPSYRWKDSRDTALLQLAAFLDVVQYREHALP